MPRILAIALILLGSTALATGERIAVADDSPLRDTLCVSMECGSSGRPEARVTSRAVKGGLEVTVTMASGERRLTLLAATRADGTISSTEVVRVSAQVVNAIETRPAASPAPVAAKAHAPRRRLLARR